MVSLYLTSHAVKECNHCLSRLGNRLVANVLSVAVFHQRPPHASGYSRLKYPPVFRCIERRDDLPGNDDFNVTAQVLVRLRV